MTDSSFFRATSEGVILSVRAAPRSSRSGVDGVAGGALKVRLHAAPVDGKANGELVEVLAEALGVPRRSVEILSGATSKTKRVLVRGIGAAALAGLA